MMNPQVRKVLESERAKARVSKIRAQKRAHKAKVPRRHGREFKRTR